jgi:cell division protease FtsH
MKKKNTSPNPINLVIIIALLVICTILYGLRETFFVDDKNNPDSKENRANSEIQYSRLLNYLEMGWVKSIDLYDNNHIAIIEASSPELGDRIQKFRVEIPTNAVSLITKLKETNVDMNAHGSRKNTFKNFYDSFKTLSVPILLVTILYLLFGRSNSGNSNGGDDLLNLREADVEIEMNSDTGITFNDIAGIDEVKEELQEIVSFLTKPSRFTAVGASVPKGVLLVGPPGTGKTLLAKAIAGEAKVPFINMSGSEFVEMFVGVGASRVRDLFEQAKNNSPCIIFIDEIDAVGRERGTGIGGGNDEREQTLNQLLTEMDGFEGNNGILVIAATNRVDVLDNALLRPGRFDRQVEINPPDTVGREAILKIHSKNKKLAADVSLDIIAQKTPGFGGAELANILNEAAILAARKEKPAIGTKEIDSALERVIAGLEGPSIVDSRNKRLFAYHEVGHAMAGTLLPDHDSVQTVTLLPRGQSVGLTWFVSKDDSNLITRSQILSRIIEALASRAAEEIVFGETELTSGASSDLMRVTDMAAQMVTRFGMSAIGPVALGSQGGGFVFVGNGIKPANEYSDSLAIKIDSQIKSIIQLCYNEAIEIIKLNRISLDDGVNQLIDKEVLSGNSFEYVISESSKLPTNSFQSTKFIAK